VHPRGLLVGAAPIVDMDAVSAARRELGQELVRRREAAGYTQTDLARTISCGRSTLGDAESGRRLCSPDLWRRADEVLGTRGALRRRRDEVAAMSTTAADEAVRGGLRQPGGRPLSGTVAGGEADPIVAARRCPSCGGHVVLTVEVGALSVPLLAAALGDG
jgi:DNA-binding XRE family transcriptional regulator